MHRKKSRKQLAGSSFLFLTHGNVLIYSFFRVHFKNKLCTFIALFVNHLSCENVNFLLLIFSVVVALECLFFVNIGLTGSFKNKGF